MRTAIPWNMNTMPVSPEKLITTFSLAQVAAMIVAFEDVTIYGREPSEEQIPSKDDAVTVRPNAAV